MLGARNKVFTRDVALKVTSRCRQFRIVAVSTLNVLHDTIERHELVKDGEAAHPVLLSQLGSTVSLANLWAALLNQEERVRVEFQGAFGSPVAESLALGESRAFVKATSSPDSAGAVKGALKVDRVLYGHMRPFVSATVAPGTSPEDTTLAAQATYHCTQSDGVPAAVLFATAFDPATMLPVYNTGVMVQPIAPSEARTGETLEVLGAIQRAFQTIMTPHTAAEIAAGHVSDDSHVRADDAERIRVTLDRRLRCGWGPHDLLALASGDWAGAAGVAEAARYCGGAAAKRLVGRLAAAPMSFTDPTVQTGGGAMGLAAGSSEFVAQLLAEYDVKAPYEGLLGDDTTAAPPSTAAGRHVTVPRWVGCDASSHGTNMIELDPTTLVKTPLDFFCRCSKEDFKRALRAVGKEGVMARRNADPDMGFKCSHCAGIWRLNPADWDDVLKAFGQAA